MHLTRNQLLAGLILLILLWLVILIRMFAIVGPTASGKSALGIEVALEINGEIINCDSVQVYKEIQIATAKVPLDERRGIPHHQIDFVSPNINYTAVEWAREATKTIEEIESRLTERGLRQGEVFIAQVGDERELIPEYLGWITMNAIIEHALACLDPTADRPPVDF